MEKIPSQIDLNILRKQEMSKENVNYYKGHLLFSILELNIWGACNRSCSFCPVSNKDFYTNKNEGISLELYTKLLEDLEKIKYNGTILFSAFSEPLLNKNINKLIELSKSILPNIHLEINSNGDVIKKNVKKLLGLYESGLDTIVISVYDGIEEYKMFECMQHENNLTDDSFIVRRRYFDEKKNDYGIIFSNRSGTVDVKSFINQDDSLDENMPLQRVCYYPFYQIMIDYNGDVLLCAHDWAKKYILGNILESSIFDLWINEKSQSARQNLAKKNRLFSPCKTCNVRGDVIGKEMFEIWQEN